MLLLLAAPAFAEILRPNADDDSTDWQEHTGGAQCDTTDCFTDISDESATTAVCDDTGTAGSVTMLVGMATPSANPTIGTDLQTVLGTASEHDDANNGSNCDFVDGNNPGMIVEVYCGGSATGEVPVNRTIGGSEVIYTGDFTYPATSECTASVTPWACCTGLDTGTCCADDGSDLEFQISGSRSGGSASQRRWLTVQELEWDAAVGGAPPARRRSMSITFN